MQVSFTLEEILQSKTMRSDVIPLLEKKTTAIIEQMVDQWMDLATVFTDNHEFDRAAQSLEVALRVGLGNGVTQALRIQLKLAEIYWRSERNFEAKRALSQCVSLANELHNLHVTCDETFQYLRDIAIMAERLSDCDLARQFAKRANHLISQLGHLSSQRLTDARQLDAIITRCSA